MTAGLTYGGYAVAAVGLVALEVWGRRTASLTLGALVDRVVSHRTLRVALFLAWAWAGWHLFVRGSAAYLR